MERMMKKLLSIIMSIICCVFLATSVLALPAADTCEEHLYPMNRSGSKEQVLLIYCQFKGDASFTGYAISSANIESLGGKYIYNVIASEGATTPTSDSDLTIIASMSNTSPIYTNTMSYDILGGNGTDLIDDADTRSALTQNFTMDLNQYHLIDRMNTYTINATNNSVNNATFMLKFIIDE